MTYNGVSWSDSDFKVFHDSVHGTIKLHPLLVSIADTPQYQRLRNIKQLGMVYHVYPGASHNRFEHGIGTSHLSGLMLKTLKDLHEKEYKDEEVLITDKDILCVQVAGLCHDLGHGPFSHTFEKYYASQNPDSNWRHEENSCAMFDFLLQQNENVREQFKQHGIEDSDILMIKRMIKGMDPWKDTIPEKTVYHGKNLQKWFLYEVVANKRTGIDCDKFDYFARDSHQVGVKNSFNHTRYFQNVRILDVGDQLQICVRDKEVVNLYEIFHVRWKLHYSVYQHKTTKVLEDMLFQALSAVDTTYGISASVKDMQAYMWMTDSIVYEILRSSDTSPEIQKAKKILHQLQKRELYSFCGEVNVCNINRPTSECGTKIVCKEIAELSENLSASDLFVDITYIGIGKKDKDPINNVVFFTKYGIGTTKPTRDVSQLIPKKFEEEYIRVWSRQSSKTNLVRDAFEQWKDKNKSDSVDEHATK